MRGDDDLQKLAYPLNHKNSISNNKEIITFKGGKRLKM